jgi:ATP-dependent Clp protease protease subunit
VAHDPPTIIDAKLCTHYANTRKAHADAALAEQNLLDLQVHYRSTLREERAMLVSTKYNRTLYIVGPIGGEIIMQRLVTLRQWVHEDAYSSEEPSGIDIFINSPGGDVMWGYALAEEMDALTAKGYIFSGYVRGMAASMAGVLLQHCANRYMSKNSWVLIHQPSTQAIGKVEDLADEAAFMDRLSKQIMQTFLDRSEGAISQRTFTNNWSRKDWTLTAEEALKYGFIDEIR